MEKKEIIDKEKYDHDIAIQGFSQSHVCGSGFFKTAKWNTVCFAGPENESKTDVAISVYPHI